MRAPLIVIAAIAVACTTKSPATIVAAAGQVEVVKISSGHETMRRRGEIRTGTGAAIPFRITGPNGKFNVSYASIAFDVNRDGTFDPDLERYPLSERYVNLEGVTYEIAVEPHGEHVTLTPATHRPDRLALKTGYPAPDFAFIDLNGVTRHLSDFRGKVVLLDFWGTWCPSCVEGVPELVRLYGAYHSRGFDIIGIEARDTREKVAAFIDGHHMPWMQTLESETGPATTVYRVTGWPTAFLVGADGQFLAANYLGEIDLTAELRKVFPPPT
jgi:peroxiredoxin